MQDNSTAHYRQFIRDDVTRYTDAVKRLNLSAAKA
jgi:hypothetical protein